MSTIFKEFPTITDYSGFELTDFSKRISITKTIKNSPSLYQEYSIQGYESAEELAQDFYEDPGLYWLIYSMNDIIDPFFGWILTQSQLEAFTADKYTDVNGLHHYELNGDVVSSTTPNAIPITNLNHEDSINEKKRKIKILRPSFVKNIKRAIQSTVNE